MHILRKIMNNKYTPHALYLLLAVAVLGKALLPGYLFLIDMPWPEDFHLANYTRTGASVHLPLLAVFTVLDWVMPAWVVQKLLLLGLLYGAGYGVYRLATYIGANRGYGLLAGALGMLNPYVAERLLSGQWLVLAGYVYAPFVLLLFLKYLDKPTRRSMLLFLAVYAAYPVVSIHWWYMTIPLLLVVALLHGQKITHRRELAGGVVAFVVLNSYWVTKIAGKNGILRTITDADFKAFETATDPGYGLLLNVLSQYGFWNDKLLAPKHYSPLWVIYGLVGFGLALYGLYVYWVRYKGWRHVVTAFGLMLVLAIVFGLGYASEHARYVVNVARHLPGFVGMRETGKYIGFLSLTVAVFSPLAIMHVQAKRTRVGALVVYVAMFGLSMHGLLLGAHGQLVAHDYPASYSAVQPHLAAAEGRTLALPWKAYLKLNYADNQFVANPVRTYFKTDVKVSSLISNAYLDKQTDFDNLVLTPSQPGWAEGLKAQGYDQVLLLKTDAWGNYRHLLQEHEVVFDSPEVALIKL